MTSHSSIAFESIEIFNYHAKSFTQVVLFRIRSFPTLIAKIKWLGYGLLLNGPMLGYRIQPWTRNTRTTPCPDLFVIILESDRNTTAVFFGWICNQVAKSSLNKKSIKKPVFWLLKNLFWSIGWIPINLQILVCNLKLLFLRKFPKRITRIDSWILSILPFIFLWIFPLKWNFSEFSLSIVTSWHQKPYHLYEYDDYYWRFDDTDFPFFHLILAFELEWIHNSWIIFC